MSLISLIHVFLFIYNKLEILEIPSNDKSKCMAIFDENLTSTEMTTNIDQYNELLWKDWFSTIMTQYHFR